MSVKVNPQWSWQTYDVFNEFKAPKFKFYVPMPNFDLKGIKDFNDVPAHIPYPLVKTIHERFPGTVPMPERHPAYSVVLMHLIPELFSELQPIDWGWHKEVYRRARERAEIERIINRVEVEETARYLHQLKEEQRLVDLRTFYFNRALQTSERQSERIVEANLHARDLSARVNEQVLNVRDERKIKEFIVRYLQEFSPTKQYLRGFIHKVQTEPSLAQVRIRNELEFTPMEVMLQVAYAKFPLVQRAMVKEAFAKHAEQVNRVHIDVENIASYRHTISKLFDTTFASNHHKLMLEQRTFDNQTYALKQHRLASDEKARTNREKEAAHLANYLDHLSIERKLFSDFKDHLQSENTVRQAQADRAYARSEHKAKMDHLVPIIIDGTTQFLQFNPAKAQTQYTLIKMWLDNVERHSFRVDKLANEQTNIRHDHNEYVAATLNMKTVSAARDFERMREATLMRDYFRQYDLRDTINAFVGLQRYQSEDLKVVGMMRAQDPNPIEQKAAAVDPVDQAYSFKKVV